MSAIGVLTQAEVQVGLEGQGLSSGSAQLGAMAAAAAVSGGLVANKGGSNNAGRGFNDFNQARNAAVSWLGNHNFKAEKVTVGKFGGNAGSPIGMQSMDGKSGFRVEFDERHGAHINVWAGKQKETFTFKGDQSAVDRLIKQFIKDRI